MSDKEPRGPDPIDIHVGRRIRDRRRALEISQERLAEGIGVTFQQVQKYEKGANRVSASKLWQTAGVLQTDIGHFFEGLKASSPGFAEAGADFVHDLMSTSEGQQLAALCPRIRRERVRRQVLALIKSLVDEEAEG
ncbi:MAG: helix-turn-helix transcriptional regulator [Caulobacteraceae bacterium]|nr:helix-turn-helix transcriptional regulator [Caulobacteraceae bacterium]